MEILLDVVMEKNSLEKKTSLSTQVGEPGPAAWASPPPTGGGTYSDPTPGMDSTITTETNQVNGLFTCLRDCRRASDGTDGTCLLTSHHLQEMIDEDLEKSTIEVMYVVRSLCFHTTGTKNKAGYRVNVR
jgi:hypothetical protein